MPSLRELSQWFTQLSPFRKLEPRKSEALLTPLNTPQPDINLPAPRRDDSISPLASRKRARESEPTESQDPFHGLRTPTSQQSTDRSSSTRAIKRLKTSSSPIQSIEKEPAPQTPLPKSGATKPAAYHDEDLSPDEWRSRREERLAEVQVLHDQGWRSADVALFRKICLRGFEPILPSHWTFDFPIFPSSLFARPDAKPCISSLNRNPYHASDFRASKTLWALIDLGIQVRDDLMLGLDPHKRIGKVFKNSLKWALQDADLGADLELPPLAIVVTAPGHVRTENLQHDLNDKLHKLAGRWRTFLGPNAGTAFPPLYGIAVSHAVWAILSFTPEGKSASSDSRDDPENFASLMHTFNFAKEGQEVWVAFAFAILAVHCRNEVLKTVQKVKEVGG